MPENRRFTRIIFSTPVTLVANDKQPNGKHANGERWNTQLVDLSLKGALLIKPTNWQAKEGEQFILDFVLPDSDIEISMRVHKAHQRDNCIGFTCDSIDIDSATHLRRLIELNVGSAELLNRDLEHLAMPSHV